MVKILKLTPFGFIFERLNGSPYCTDDYEIYLDGELHSRTNRNVNTVFGLKCNRRYDVKVGEYQFEVETTDPEFIINVKDYNAFGDAVTCDTSAVNLAVYTAPAGSVVYFPKGEYLIDQLLLKSGVDIYLERGAVLRQNFVREKLGILKGYQRNYHHSTAEVNASWEGHPLDCYASLIYGKNVENVHIYGEGTIDGNGEKSGFWVNPKVKDKAYRPKNVLLVHCKNIEISGIASINSASWNLHPFYCENISLRCLKIESFEQSPNTDGINPESCRNVEIIGCHFSVGDDCIAVKSGKYYMSTAHLQPCEDILVRNCFMEKGHGGVVIGSEMSCGIKNICVSQCLFFGTDRGLRIKTRRGRGIHAVVDGIAFNNVVMNRVRHCFVVNMYYNCDPDGKSEYVRDKNFRPKDEFTPEVKNITLTDVKGTDILGSAVFIYGLPESRVTGIRINNCSFNFVSDQERITECPAMMDDFEVTEKIDFFIANADKV